LKNHSVELGGHKLLLGGRVGLSKNFGEKKKIGGKDTLLVESCSLQRKSLQ